MSPHHNKVICIGSIGTSNTCSQATRETLLVSITMYVMAVIILCRPLQMSALYNTLALKAQSLVKFQNKVSGYRFSQWHYPIAKYQCVS